ncbi:cell division topological specificity factor MinE [Acetobacteraceae bacterium]|nr:cell division topological specificity factor MinE [Acetobacteraceae bacterium]
MIMLGIFRSKKRKATSSVAKERLQILLTHERGGSGPDQVLLANLREDILAVVEKYFPIDRQKLNIGLTEQADQSRVEIDIEVPKNLGR